MRLFVPNFLSTPRATTLCIWKPHSAQLARGWQTIARSEVLGAVVPLPASARNYVLQFFVPNFLATPDSPSAGQNVLEQERVVVMASIVCGESLAVPLQCPID